MNRSAWCLVITTMLAGASLPVIGEDAEPIAAPADAGAAAAAVPGPFKSPGEQLGYALGYRIGQRIIADHKALGTPLDAAALGRGLADAVRESPPALDEEGFRRVFAEFEKHMAKRQQELAARMETAARENIEKGKKFLEANGKRPGVKVLPSGLQYEVLAQGTGPKPTLDSVVTAHYRGTHIDGSEFDGTDPEGEPAAFPLRGVVPGWQEALQQMAKGSKWRVWLPPELGYGEGGSPPAIEPNEVLIFEIELLGIE